MKKLAVSILCACMVSSMLIGCGGGSGSTATSEMKQQTTEMERLRKEEAVKIVPIQLMYGHLQMKCRE